MHILRSESASMKCTRHTRDIMGGNRAGEFRVYEAITAALVLRRGHTSLHRNSQKFQAMQSVPLCSRAPYHAGFD